MQLILISGLSGSGKSVALRSLEDAGYYCVDNLPVSLLLDLVHTLRQESRLHLAVSVDARGGESVGRLPSLLDALREVVSDLKILFFEARDDSLIARFSETRRAHPLGHDDITLDEAITKERQAMQELAALASRIDTSDLSPNNLRNLVRDFVHLKPTEGITLLFESFGYKYGIPTDADLVFDVRCLPNPYYDKTLRGSTGQDKEVIEYLEAEPMVVDMRDDVYGFIERWIHAYFADDRRYLTVAIGCTGGQHRSVYIAEWLAKKFSGRYPHQIRHRSLNRLPVLTVGGI